jgi:hypothetical protein
MFCAKNKPVPECTMLFGCKLSFAIVSKSVRVRSSDRLPSGGTSVVVVTGVSVVVVATAVDVVVEVRISSSLAQAASPITMLMLMIKRFTPARL